MNIDFAKYADGLVPAVVQDYNTQKVLMLGFMNGEAVKKTEETKPWIDMCELACRLAVAVKAKGEITARIRRDVHTLPNGCQSTRTRYSIGVQKP